MIELHPSVTKLIGGLIAGGGTIILTYEGIMPIEPAIAILSSMMAYFVGEKNGQTQTIKNLTSELDALKNQTKTDTNE